VRAGGFKLNTQRKPQALQALIPAFSQREKESSIPFPICVNLRNLWMIFYPQISQICAD